LNDKQADPALLRSLPSVDRLLASPALQPLIAAHSRQEVLREVRLTLAALRRDAEGLTAEDVTADAVCQRVAAGLERRASPYYRRVINGTGIILHTGLGRAVLAPEAVAALVRVAAHPQRLEIDLGSGQRGGRDEGCAALLRELTGCEAATVVNNNAAATLLILAALARGKRVIVSRGELVEIGGSFRIPDVLRESGAVLSEVGTTNRTHLRDYAEAIGDETGMILKVHPSNYRVQGFTAEVEIEELVALARPRGVPVVHDVGSGCLVDLAARGVRGETVLQRSIGAGADLVCCSGDKLLGGPQAGLILGRKEAVERCRRHPLMRAMRPGRLVYTALEATLRLYLGGEEKAIERIPTLRLLLEPQEVLRRRAQRLARRLEGVAASVAVTSCTSQAGSGSLPTRDLASWGVRVRPADDGVEELATELRTGEPAILARVQEDALLFDVRTLSDQELPLIAERLHRLRPSGQTNFS
jgi:L-seryl-tRNA(Ser) seleniumtransferase